MPYRDKPWLNPVNTQTLWVKLMIWSLFKLSKKEI